MQSETGDDGNFLMRASALMKEGSLAAGAPGAPQNGRHENAALVDKYQASSQAMDFFLMRGQSHRIQF